MARPAKVFSITQLQAMIRDRKSELSSMKKERTAIVKRLSQIEKTIASSHGTASVGRPAGVRGRGRGRASNSMSLAGAIEAVLHKAADAISISDIMQKVKSAGYKSSSPNFRSMVSQTLINKKNPFQKGRERGTYAIKR